MRAAREATKEDSFVETLCLLEYYFKIDSEKILDMPYLRCELMTEWLLDWLKKTAPAQFGQSNTG
jgi:hypothetical protein